MRPRKLARDHTATKMGAGIRTWDSWALGIPVLNHPVYNGWNWSGEEEPGLFLPCVLGPCLAVATTYFLWKLPIGVCTCICMHVYKTFYTFTSIQLDEFTQTGQSHGTSTQNRTCRAMLKNQIFCHFYWAWSSNCWKATSWKNLSL